MQRNGRALAWIAVAVFGGGTCFVLLTLGFERLGAGVLLFGLALACLDALASVFRPLDAP